MFIVNVCSFGQIVQKGSVLEYNGSEPKTVIYEPITITAVGAPSTYSDTGKFFLNFLDKKKEIVYSLLIINFPNVLVMSCLMPKR